MLLPCDMFITYPVLKIRLTLYILLICVKSELARKNNCLKKTFTSSCIFNNGQ